MVVKQPKFTRVEEPTLLCNQVAERSDGRPYQEENRDVDALLSSNVGPLFEKRVELSVFQKVVTIHERLVASGCVALRRFKLALLF